MTSNAPLITNLSTQQINASLIALRNNISESSGNFIELEGNITSLNEQYNSLNKDVNCLIYEVECIKCCTGNVSKDIPKMKDDIEALQKDVANVTNLTCTINNDIGDLRTCTTSICSCINCYIFRDYTYCCINGSCVSIGKHVNCLSFCLSSCISDLSSCISDLETYVQQSLAGFSCTMNQTFLGLQNQINCLSDRVSALENA